MLGVNGPTCVSASGAAVLAAQATQWQRRGLRAGLGTQVKKQECRE